jgi:hypothetical protein
LLFSQKQVTDTNSAKLEIRYFTKANAGKYTCIAQNEYGETAVEEFTVNMMTAGSPPLIYIQPKHIEAYEGSTLTINFTYTVTQLFDMR